jgi:hypothetical protein
MTTVVIAQDSKNHPQKRRWKADTPMSRAETAQVARAAIEEWKDSNATTRARIVTLLQTLSEEEVVRLIPQSFFVVYSTKVISGRRLGLFLQLVELSALGKATLTLSPGSGFMGIQKVEIAAEHRAALDAMPFPSQGALLRAMESERAAEVKALVWREATFIEVETLHGGLVLTHQPFVRPPQSAKSKKAKPSPECEIF